jgi:hypothetical protein
MNAAPAKSRAVELRCPTCHLPVAMPQQAASAGEPRLKESFVSSFDSSLAVAVTLLLSGAVAGSMEFITHLVVSRMHTPLEFHAFIDASVMCFMTMTLVGVAIASIRARRQAAVRQIRAVAELNHHLRNALQVIAQSRYLPEEKQSQAVLVSIGRIDEALRRLVPE